LLKAFFHYYVDLKRTIREAATAAVETAIPFWEKARIPIREKKHLITKVEKLHEKWKTLKKTRYRKGEKQKQDEAKFLKILNNLFDMAKKNALQTMKIEEDKQFLLAQREDGRRGTMGGVDKVLAAKEKRIEKRKDAEVNFKTRMEQSGPSHIDTNQTDISCTSAEESDEECIPISSLMSPDLKKALPCTGLNFYDTGPRSSTGPHWSFRQKRCMCSIKSSGKCGP